MALKSFIIISILLIPTILSSNAQESPAITLLTDKSDYILSEFVTVEGIVENCVEDSNKITVKFYNPRDEVFHARILDLDNCSFKYSMQLSGSLAFGGMWRVVAEYLEESAEYSFFVKEPKKSVSGDFKDGKIQVDVSLSNGSVEVIRVNPDSLSLELLVVTSTTRDGTLEITLPRDLIDATHEDGSDADFLVLIDLAEVEFEEVAKTNKERILSIPVPAGAHGIEIIGTYVIPEFGPIAVFIMGAAILFAVLAPRRITNVRIK